MPLGLFVEIVVFTVIAVHLHEHLVIIDFRGTEHDLINTTTQGFMLPIAGDLAEYNIAVFVVKFYSLDFGFVNERFYQVRIVIVGWGR